MNRDTAAARRYHAETAHSPQSVRTSGHALDWEIKPSPFKIYPDLVPAPLDRDFPALGTDVLRALSGEPPGRAERLDRSRLAALLHFSAGITKHRVYPGGGEVFFRAAPSTGALYQTEVYVVAGAVDGLGAGVYHFSPGDFALRPLRARADFRAVLAVAAADDAIAAAPATLVTSAIYWRNTWKYRARGYRHLFWDAGTLLANLLGAARALALPARLVTGFVEREVNGLLGLDPEKEGALVLVPVGAEGAPAPIAPIVSPLAHAVIPLSSREVDEPLLRDAYANSSFDAEAEVIEWRDGPALGAGAGSRPGGVPVALPAPREEAGRALDDTILARGSTRRFSGESISLGDLSTALSHAARAVPADLPGGLPDGCVELYLTVHAVDGLAPGAYHYRSRDHALDQLAPGDFRRESAFLSLEQALGGTSSATVFFLADLAALLERFGNRGYRLANLAAGLCGGRLYLVAYGLGFGATGLTYYDRQVVEFFSPHAAGREAIFVTALGRSARGPASPLIPPPTRPAR